MRFTRVVWWALPQSFIVGWHYGRNPASGQRFLCLGLGFINIDFELKPYGLNEKYRKDNA